MLNLDSFLIENNEKSLTYFNLTNPLKFNSLKKFNILISFSDSVVYKNKAFLLVGSANSGKTYVSSRLSKLKDFDKLSEDCTLNLLKEEQIFIPKSCFDYKVHFSDLSNESFPLQKIFYLKQKGQNNLSKEEILAKMFRGNIEQIKKYNLERLFDQTSIKNIVYSKRIGEKYSLIKNSIEEAVK